MQTYTYRQGTTPLPLILSADDGPPYDLTGATVALELRDGATCVPVPVTVIEPLAGAVLPDAEALDALSVRPRRGTLRVTWPDGTKEAADIAITIKGGC